MSDDSYLKDLQEELFEDAKKKLAENGYELGEYNPHRVSAWWVVNDHVKCLAIGQHEQEAIDNCVDANLWDSLKMSDEDLEEYESNGWHDSFIRAGNASEAFWSENLVVRKILTA
ncbi:hypothetical protein QX249_10445 [Vibrio parahaemolyticus]|uniref:Uncharacterized protein n=1 Tax=Vibrio parahaemolyticus TaxID=670 RepID=A0AAW8PYJ9_VIBPH|nr:hypothetical protein [Vibrio parahaemolyticus]MDS1821079.1 hypothetical protein [Vibrio parahaemolyticus]